MKVVGLIKFVIEQVVASVLFVTTKVAFYSSPTLQKLSLCQDQALSVWEKECVP